jgi:hypothetical protein
MDALSLFGLFAVSAMLVCYALERRSHWFILAQYTVSCRAHGIEAIWAGVALCRWMLEPRTA